MSTIKLTKRGKNVVEGAFLFALVAVSVVFMLMFTLWLGYSVEESNQHTQAPTIECVQDTVIQPDGTCMPQER